MAKVRDEMLLGAAKGDGREKVDVILQPQSPLLQQVHERGYDHIIRKSPAISQSRYNVI
jgi:hypothetical protein